MLIITFRLEPLNKKGEEGRNAETIATSKKARQARCPRLSLRVGRMNRQKSDW